MLGLPKATEISKQLPKKAIYAKFQMSDAAKDKIDEDIARITIVNEVTPNSMNIPAGDTITGFYVMLVSLKRKEFGEKTIVMLSKLIPQNIVFVLEYGDESKLAVYHDKIIQTAWKPTAEQVLELHGLNFDSVWENIVIAVGSVELRQGNTLDGQIAADEQRRKLQAKIDRLEKQARAERQPRKKFDLFRQIKSLTAQLHENNITYKEENEHGQAEYADRE